MVGGQTPRARTAALAIGLLLCSCGNAGEQACLDFADVFLEVSVAQCPFVLPGDNSVLRETMRANLKCSLVVGVADEDVLRGTCFRELEQLTCDQITAGKLPPSCFGKLVYAPP